MKRIVLLWATVGLLLAGCGDSREQVIEESLETSAEINELLERVKKNPMGKASEEAEPRLKELQAELVELKKRMQALGEAEEDQLIALNAQYGEALKKEVVTTNSLVKSLRGNSEIRAEFVPVAESVDGLLVSYTKPILLAEPEQEDDAPSLLARIWAFVLPILIVLMPFVGFGVLVYIMAGHVRDNAISVQPHLFEILLLPLAGLLIVAAGYFMYDLSPRLVYLVHILLGGVLGWLAHRSLTGDMVPPRNLRLGTSLASIPSGILVWLGAVFVTMEALDRSLMGP